MTLTSKFLKLAEKYRLLTNIGVILHPLISQLAVLPYFYCFILDTNKKNSESGVSTVAAINFVIYVFQFVGQSLTAYHLFKEFLLSIALDGLSGPKFLYLMIPAIVLPYTFLIIMTCTYHLPRLNSVYFTVAFCIGSVFLILHSILSLLVFGVSCSYLRKEANGVLLFEIHEDKVTELVRVFNNLRNKASPYLFVMYTITTLQLIIFLYGGLIMNSCFLVPLANNIVMVLTILGYCLLLTFISFTTEDMYNNVKDVQTTLRLELRMTKAKERRQMLKGLILEVETCEPFTALGFYTIDKSTLTATLGTVLTYCIILFQTVTCTTN